MMRATITKSVTTPSEYREAINAAETLGLELSRVMFTGTWQTQTSDGGHVCWPTANEVIAVHNKYFTVEMDGSEFKIEADDGELILGFD